MTNRKELTQNEIDSVVSHLRIHKRVRERSGNHVIADCPSCGKKAKLYVNTDTGMYDCKAGKCQVSGNLFGLANLLNVRVRENRLVDGAATVLAASFMKGAGKRLVPAANGKGLSLDYFTRLVDDMLEGDERMMPALDYLHGRGFDDVTIQHFRLSPWKLPKRKDVPAELGIAIPVIVGDKTPFAKLRNLQDGKKRRFERTTGGDSALYNGDAVRNCRQVILCEAELDACSIWQLGHTNVAATSLGAKRELPAEWLHQLSAADDMVLWYDDDEAGQQAVSGLLVQLGIERCRIARLDAADGLLEKHPGIKDANDLLRLDEDEDTLRAWTKQIIDRAKPIDQDDVVSISELAAGVLPSLDQDPLGVPWKLDALNGLLKGCRGGEVTTITGHSGHGKTSFASFLAEGLADHFPVLLTSFENGPTNLVRKVFQREFGRPISTIKTEAHLEEAQLTLQKALANPNLFVANVEGRQDKAKFFAMCRWAAKRLGVKAILVDHMHYFARDRADQGNEHIEKLAQDLKNEVAKKLNVHVINCCHVNAAVDEVKIPSGGNLKGGSGVKQEADNGITVYRSKDLNGSGRDRDLKLRDGAGRPVSVTLGPTQTLVYVWKTRHEEAEEGVFVADFSRSNLTYSSPKVEADTPAETLAAQMDELDEEDDLFGGF